MLKRVEDLTENNNNLSWIAKMRMEIKLNRLENVLTHHKIIEVYCLK